MLASSHGAIHQQIQITLSKIAKHAQQTVLGEHSMNADFRLTLTNVQACQPTYRQHACAYYT